MTLLRPLIAFFLTSLLAACGGEYDLDTTARTAAAATIAGASAFAGTPATGPNPAPGAPLIATTATLASATMPAPDCAAEGCVSLRIIDGNAEAWRIDAQRRAAREAGLPQS
ncbi:hypothetical protein ABIB38_002539 [Massilia sp. UYP11]|uniref:hypothetical protein n=1 Tax=Massilia sp. UYP11 TaxID=1756385 RepID=UPI003D2515FA